MMILVFIILIITVVLSVWGKLRPDMVALLSVLALFLGSSPPPEALGGFAKGMIFSVELAAVQPSFQRGHTECQHGLIILKLM
jgi:hypothetical protein